MKDLKVLFIQNKLCSRAWKEAKTLTDAGVSVSLLEFRESSVLHDYSIFSKHMKIPIEKKYVVTRLPVAKFVFTKHLKKTVRENDFDLIHTHNSPDVFPIWAKSSTCLPVVHDIHDIQTLVPHVYFPNDLANKVFSMVTRYWEYAACKMVDAIVSPSSYTKDFLDRKYRIKVSKALENKPDRVKVVPKKKISSRDGSVHLVYEGAMNLTPGSHRYMLPLFRQITSATDFHVHVYAVMTGDATLEEFRQRTMDDERLHIHDPLPPPELIPEMTKYDFGLCLFPFMTENLRFASPNKVYEYQLAGLPVINNSEGNAWDYIERKGCGINIGEIHEIKEAVLLKREYNLNPSDCYMKADEVLGLYRKVLNI